MNPVFRRLHRIEQVRQTLGARWMIERGSYSLKLKTGWARRAMPLHSWDARPLAEFLTDSRLAAPEQFMAARESQKDGAPRFLFSPAQRAEWAPILRAFDEAEGAKRKPQEAAREILAGTLPYFSSTPGEIGFPPRWNFNPFENLNAPTDRHWSQIGDFEAGDIKIFWEPNRFSWVFPLLRAHWREPNDEYAEAFWRAVESWRESNSPGCGVNWKCGQEIALRCLAQLFGLYGFWDSPATTPARVALLGQMMALAASRIEKNIAYALGQQNNHGMSEAAGLWTIGTLFPEFKDAARWRTLGAQLLEREARALIYEDGSFAQHSVVYHRLMLHLYNFVLRLGDLNGEKWSETLRDRIYRAGLWLYQLQDPVSGRVPNYGSTDGALILPLSDCEFQDFRPIVSTTLALKNQSLETRGAWDEELLWLGGKIPQSAEKPPVRESWSASEGGYHTLRGRESWVFTRCLTSFRHRPGGADILAVDLWWRAQNLALDAGTYSYNAPPPWNNSLSRTEFHNTVDVDGAGQMEQASKFLMLPWLHGKTAPRRKSAAGNLEFWAGQHDGFARLPAPVAHRRAILRLGGDSYLVLDALHSEAPHDYRLHWLLADEKYSWDAEKRDLRLHTPRGDYGLQIGEITSQISPSQQAPLEPSLDVSLVRADSDSPRGWHAPLYKTRVPALSLGAKLRAHTALFWSLWSEEAGEVQFENDGENFAFLLRGSWGLARVEGEWAGVCAPPFEGGLSVRRVTLESATGSEAEKIAVEELVIAA